MRKLFVCALMLAVIVAFSGTTNPTALAQDTKKDKDTKKATSKGGPGVIEIGEGKDGKYRFFIRDGDGKLLAMSSPGGFASEKEATKAIEELRTVIGRAKITSVKKATKDKK